MDLHNQIVNTLKEKYLADESISAMFVIGSVARGDYSATSDIDLILITEKEPEKSFEESLVEGLVVEIKKGTLSHFQIKMEDDPMRVWQFVDAKALFDRKNCLKILKETADKILSAYEPRDLKAILKWLSSVKIKIISAKATNDNLMIGYQVSNVLWKIIQGLYETNKTPTPASTTAYRNIFTLPKFPKDFKDIWRDLLQGNLEARTQATLILIDYIVTQNL
jgi:predicted nucleotidyltransferase